MKEDFKNKESLFSEKKVGRLFEHTTAWENERLKEKEARSNGDTVQILMITAVLLVSCGVYGVVITVELDQENIRYSRKIQIALSIAVMVVGALIIRLALNQAAGFRRNSKMIRFWIGLYLFFSCGILFEISLFNLSTVNISISIAGVIQSIILLPAIIEERRRMIEPVFSHGALIYVCLRGFLAYDWYEQCPVSSMISLGIIAISGLARVNQIHAKIADKKDEQEYIKILRGDIVNIKVFYSNVLQYIPHGIAFIDEQMTVTYSNHNLQSMLNCHKNEDLFSALNTLSWTPPQDVSEQQRHQTTQQISSKLNIQDKSRPLFKATASNRLIQLPDSKSSKVIDGGKLNNNNGPSSANNGNINERNKSNSNSSYPLQQSNYVNRQSTGTTGKDHGVASKALLVVPEEELHPGNDIDIRERVTSIERAQNNINNGVLKPAGSAGNIIQHDEACDKQPRKMNTPTKGSLIKILEKIFANTKGNASLTSINQQQNGNTGNGKNNPNIEQQQAQLKLTKKQSKNIEFTQSKSKTSNTHNINNNTPPNPKRGITASKTAAETVVLPATPVNPPQDGSDKTKSPSEISCKIRSPPIQENIHNIGQAPRMSTQALSPRDVGVISEEEACEIEANDMEGKKLNIKIVLYELDWEGEAAAHLSLGQYPFARSSTRQVCRSLSSMRNMRESLVLMLIEDLSQAQMVKKLENQNEYKMRMLASVSHELRTPLNCSISMLQIMRENLLHLNEIDMIKNNLDPALYSSKLLLNLINDILDFAQLEAGKFRITCQDFNLKQIFLECFVLISIQSKMKNLRLKLQMGVAEQEYKTSSQLETAFDYDNEPASKFLINSDPNRVRQIILNLLSNALKFTNYGSITLKAQILDTKPLAIEITCEDTGIGIPPDRCLTIFDNFNKADLQNRIKYNQCGAGLGLSISNQLAKVLCPSENQHQPIVVVSQEGKGSSFSFVIQDQTVGSSVAVANGEKAIAKQGVDRVDSNNRIEGSMLKIEDQGNESSNAKADETIVELRNNNINSNNSFKFLPPQAGSKAFQSSKKSQFGKNNNSSSSITQEQYIRSQDNIDKYSKSNIVNLRGIKTHEDYSCDNSKRDFLSSQKDINNNNNSELDKCQLNATTLRPLTYQEANLELQMSFDPEQSIRGPSYRLGFDEVMIDDKDHNEKEVEDDEINEPWKDKYFDVSSPTKITPGLQPQNLEVARNELEQKKKRESSSSSSASELELPKPFSNIRVNSSGTIVPIQGISINPGKQPLSQDQSNQNYVYSYSLNSTSNQSQNPQPSARIKESMKLGAQSKSVSIQGRQKLCHKSLDAFKAFQLQRKCGHPQVLVVDDNQFNIIALQHQLSKFHLDIDMAFSGEQAINKIQQRVNSHYSCCPLYLVVFMDIDMPVMNGYEATSTIQTFFKQNQIQQYDCPIIACSAYVNPEDKLTALNSGMLDYITKPIMLGTLDKVLINWFVAQQGYSNTTSEMG